MRNKRLKNNDSESYVPGRDSRVFIRSAHPCLQSLDAFLVAWSLSLCWSTHILLVWVCNVLSSIQWFDNLIPFRSLGHVVHVISCASLPMSFCLWWSPLEFVWLSACRQCGCIWLSHSVRVVQSIFMVSNRSCTSVGFVSAICTRSAYFTCCPRWSWFLFAV